jgi:hypothetical protein
VGLQFAREVASRIGLPVLEASPAWCLERERTAAPDQEKGRTMLEKASGVLGTLLRVAASLIESAESIMTEVLAWTVPPSIG